LIARVSNGAEENVSAPGHAAALIGTIPPGADRVIPPLAELGRASGRDGTLLRSRKRAVWVIGVALVMLAGVLVWRWEGTGMQVSPVVIAVLPFEHLGGDPEREYLTDGLTEEISASLGQIDPAQNLSIRYKTGTASRQSDPCALYRRLPAFSHRVGCGGGNGKLGYDPQHEAERHASSQLVATRH
jgi:hypothetical protein